MQLTVVLRIALTKLKFSIVRRAVLFGLITSAAHAASVSVTNTSDNLAGSLRQIIHLAQTGDNIVFRIPTDGTDPGYDAATTVFTIGLTSGELAIDKNLTIDGSAHQKIVISGTHTSRVFHVVTGNLNISN